MPATTPTSPPGEPLPHLDVRSPRGPAARIRPHLDGSPRGPAARILPLVGPPLGPAARGPAAQARSWAPPPYSPGSPPVAEWDPVADPEWLVSVADWDANADAAPPEWHAGLAAAPRADVEVALRRVIGSLEGDLADAYSVNAANLYHMRVYFVCCSVAGVAWMVLGVVGVYALGCST